jgi:hypothetical protein
MNTTDNINLDKCDMALYLEYPINYFAGFAPLLAAFVVTNDVSVKLAVDVTEPVLVLVVVLP